MANPQITDTSTTELLKDGLKAGGAVVQPGFKLTDVIVKALSITHMDELGEWHEDDFTILLASLRAQKIPVPVAAFKKLELASEMIQVWKSCKIPLEITFFSPARMEVWKKHLLLRKRLKDQRSVEKSSPVPRIDKKMTFVKWIHRFEHWTMGFIGLNDCGLYWVIRDEAFPIDLTNSSDSLLNW